MKIEAIRKKMGAEEIDYPMLISCLKEFNQPRDKISAWIRSGALIRVKKGLYVFGKEIAQRPFSLEVLANRIYGPSAISGIYALSYYGMIPERVVEVTSITNKRNKLFSTPVGSFSYRYLHSKKYSIGLNLEKNQYGNHFLIASPEKALADQIILFEKGLIIQQPKEFEEYLYHNLRIDPEIIQSLNITYLNQISEIYKKKILTRLINFLIKKD